MHNTILLREKNDIHIARWSLDKDMLTKSLQSGEYLIILSPLRVTMTVMSVT